MRSATRRRPLVLRGARCESLLAYCLSLSFLRREMEADDTEWQRALRPPTTIECISRATGASQITRAAARVLVSASACQ